VFYRYVLATCEGHFIKQMQVEAFSPERPIKGFDEGIVRRFGSLREADAHAMMISVTER
jgi:hypothetical protein